MTAHTTCDFCGDRSTFDIGGGPFFVSGAKLEVHDEQDIRWRMDMCFECFERLLLDHIRRDFENRDDLVGAFSLTRHNGYTADVVDQILGTNLRHTDVEHWTDEECLAVERWARDLRLIERGNDVPLPQTPVAIARLRRYWERPWRH